MFACSTADLPEHAANAGARPDHHGRVSKRLDHAPCSTVTAGSLSPIPTTPTPTPTPTKTRPSPYPFLDDDA